MALKTVATFHNLIEADIVRAKLAASGIQSHIVQEAYQSLMPGQLPWEIKLQVPEDLFEDAKTVVGFQEPTEPSRSKAKSKACPQCGAENTQSGFLMRALTVILSLGLAMVLPLKFQKCQKCGYRF